VRDGRVVHSICGAELDAEIKKSVSSVLYDLFGLTRRRMGERCPVTSALSTSFSFASSCFTFHPIGIPIATEEWVEICQKIWVES
jgi:hypothetical protein